MPSVNHPRIYEVPAPDEREHPRELAKRLIRERHERQKLTTATIGGEDPKARYLNTSVDRAQNDVVGVTGLPEVGCRRSAWRRWLEMKG